MYATDTRQVRTRRLWAAWAVALALAVSGAGASQALAEPGQTGTGETSLIIKTKDNLERGGTKATDEFANPDLDGDGVGDNLAFTVPIRIDFAALSNGDIVGPQDDAAAICNESYFGIHVSSLKISAENGWAIVDDAMEETRANSIDFTIGPANDQLNAAQYQQKAEVSSPKEWNMAAKSKSQAGGRVAIKASGHVNNVQVDLLNEAAFGQINWYVKPGQAN